MLTNKLDQGFLGPKILSPLVKKDNGHPTPRYVWKCPFPQLAEVRKLSITIYCQTPDLDQDLGLGVDFVFTLEQEPPTKVYRKNVKYRSEIWHISLTHKNKIK